MSCWCPNSAHGTNPATAALIGFSVRAVPGRRRRHRQSPTPSERALGPDVAAIMLTNPNTCGLFEREIVGDRRGGARGRRVTSIATAPISTRSSARRARAISASTRCISICTRPFRRRMAAAARAPGRSCFRSARALRAGSLSSSRDGDALRLVEHREGIAGLRADDRLPRPDGHVRARARVHPVAWRRRTAAGLRGRGALGQLRPRVASTI